MLKMLDAGYWIFKGNYPYFIQHQAPSIQYLPTLAQKFVFTILSYWFQLVWIRTQIALFCLRNRYLKLKT
jgi:hypothetical protein